MPGGLVLPRVVLVFCVQNVSSLIIVCCGHCKQSAVQNTMLSLPVGFGIGAGCKGLGLGHEDQVNSWRP